MSNPFHQQKSLAKLTLEAKNEISKHIHERETLYGSFEKLVSYYEDELSIRSFIVKNFHKTATGVSFEIYRGNQKVTRQSLKRNGLWTLNINGKVLAIGASGNDVAHRIYELLKAYFDMSRHDEDSQLGRELFNYLQENNIKDFNSFSLHYTPIQFEEYLEPKEILPFLNEVKKMLIMKYAPILNEYFHDEIVDKSED